MGYVIKFGKTYRIFNEEDIKVSQDLPANTYSVIKDEMSGEFMLQPIDTFEMPAKFYGNTQQQAERILNTFKSRKKSTGVHLDGVKGSGKTLLAKHVANLAIEQGYPAIVINNAFCGESFNKFIQSIDVPAVILFDEFEKIYSYQDQNQILTLFDGVYPSKKLFILTTNDAYSVNNFLKNRPGRIYYSFSFDTLEQDFIREYCEDNLKDKSQLEGIMTYTKVFSFFNFDMLAAAIEEMNRYGESLQEVLKYLNIVPENKADDSYTISFKAGQKTATIEEHYRGFNPNSFEYFVSSKEGELDEFKNSPILEYIKEFLDNDGDIHFNSSMIKSYDPVANEFVFSKTNSKFQVDLLVKRNENTERDLIKMLL